MSDSAASEQNERRTAEIEGMDGREYGGAEITKHEVWWDEEGDVEILCSDSVLIRVHQYQLKTWSPVLRHMLDACTSSPLPRLEFTDERLENSTVVANVIDMSFHQKVKLCFEEDHEDVLHAILLSHKYEFGLILCLIRYELRLIDASSEDAAFGDFLLALALEEFEIGMSFLIKYLHGWHSERQHRHPTLDTSCWTAVALSEQSLKGYLVLPPKIMWALGRFVPDLDVKWDRIYGFRELLDENNIKFSFNP